MRKFSNEYRIEDIPKCKERQQKKKDWVIKFDSHDANGAGVMDASFSSPGDAFGDRINLVFDAGKRFAKLGLPTSLQSLYEKYEFKNLQSILLVSLSVSEIIGLTNLSRTPVMLIQKELDAAIKGEGRSFSASLLSSNAE